MQCMWSSPSLHPTKVSHVSLFAPQVPVLGAVVNKVPAQEQVIVSTQLARRCSESKMPLLGAIPEDAILRSVRLDEVQKALDAELLFASKLQLDQVGTVEGVGKQLWEGVGLGCRVKEIGV